MNPNANSSFEAFPAIGFSAEAAYSALAMWVIPWLCSVTAVATIIANITI